MIFYDSGMRRLKLYNMIIAKSVAILANILLACLVAKHTKKILKPYKRILVITIISDLGLSIFAIMFQTVSSRMPWGNGLGNDLAW